MSSAKCLVLSAKCKVLGSRRHRYLTRAPVLESICTRLAPFGARFLPEPFQIPANRPAYVRVVPPFVGVIFGVPGENGTTNTTRPVTVPKLTSAPPMVLNP